MKELDKPHTINWREQIDPKYLYVNKGWFEKFGKRVPKTIDGLNDNQLLIQLGGLKEVAKLAGYKSVDLQPIKVSYGKELEDTICIYKCNIVWSDGTYYSDIGSVTRYNSGEFELKHADTCAYNRALARCIRNSLGIYICSQEELIRNVAAKEEEAEEKKTKISKPTNSAVTKKLAEAKGLGEWKDFEKFIGSEIDLSFASCFEDLSSKDCRLANALLEKKK